VKHLIVTLFLIAPACFGQATSGLPAVPGAAVQTNITGSTQCVQAGTTGILAGTGSTCGSGGGGGTVTAVSVATANGVSGTSSGGATPALTLSLGAINPSSVGATTPHPATFTTLATGPGSVSGGSSIPAFSLSYPTVLDVENTVTTAAAGNGTDFTLGAVLAPTADSSNHHWNQYSEIITSGAHNFSGENIAIFGEFDHNGTGNYSGDGVGMDGEAYVDSTGPYTGVPTGGVSQALIGVQGLAGSYASATATNAWGMRGMITIGGSGTITSAADYEASAPWINSGTNSVTNLYGLLVETLTYGTNNYGVYTNEPAGANTYALYNAGTAQSYFGGNLISAGSLTLATARKGTFTCTAGGTITITNALELDTSDVVISLNAQGGTISTAPAMKTVTSGTGFSVLCGAADTSTYNYDILN
jgi:hypothetical protein